MKNIIKPSPGRYAAIFFCLMFLSPVISAFDAKAERPDQDDLKALNMCKEVILLFRQYSDSIWPGYDLSQRPFLIYMPERWALLFNYQNNVDEFRSFPEDWPSLGTNVLYHKGQYKDLAGQLAFEVPIDTLKVVAISCQGQSETELFEYIVHEAFHQYQYDLFGEIPWEREEKYPIQDRENTALACLEMHILMDALSAAEADNKKDCLEFVKQFIAVREHRWKLGDSFVARYEQGQEINEGTAKYVEVKGAAMMAHMKQESSLSEPDSSLSDRFSMTMPGLLLDDFQDRLTAGSVSPEDMARNRIYPVAATEGFLLDYFNIDWKTRAQEAGPEFTFTGLLKGRHEFDDDQPARLLQRAKVNYDYEEILASAESLIVQYAEGFQEELAKFESQPGYRVEIELKSGGIRRSRNSRSKKWLVDNGTRELRGHFNIYTLKDDELLLHIRDTGLLEKNDWDKGTREVIFYVPEIKSIMLDGEPLDMDAYSEYRFASIEINSLNMKFSCTKRGTITFDEGKLMVNLLQ